MKKKRQTEQSKNIKQYYKETLLKRSGIVSALQVFTNLQRLFTDVRYALACRRLAARSCFEGSDN
jgi:hypothetical protein